MPRKAIGINLFKTARFILMAVILPLVMVAINVGNYVSAAAPSVIIDIKPTGNNVSAGSEFTVRVDVSTVTDLQTFVFYLTYDPTVIRVKGTQGGAGVIAGQITDSSVTPAVVKSIPITWRFDPAGAQGRIRVEGDLNAPVLQGANGPGTIAHVTFQVIGSYGQSSEINIAKSDIEMTQTRQIPLSVLRTNPATETIPYPPVTVSIDAPATVPSGDELTAQVNVSLVANLSTFQFDIVYNPGVLQIKGEEGGEEGVTPGFIGTSNIPVSIWLYAPIGVPGIIRIIGAVENSIPVTGQGYLCKLHFDVIGEHGDTSPLIFEDHDVFHRNLFRDSSDDVIEGVTWTGKTVEVISSYRITTASPLPSGEVGRPYSKTLLATGGATPYTYSITSGALPAGLKLNPTGLINGTPTAAVTSTSITFQVKDQTNALATKTLLLTIASPPEISTVSPLPNGEAGMSYTRTMTAVNGLGPFTWSKSAGNLPPGLTISAGGVISGTPTLAGTYNFILQAVDSVGGTAIKPFTVTIVPNPSIATPSPLPNGEVNITYTLTLTPTGGISPYTYSILSGTLPNGITLSPNGTISGKTTSAGISNFTVQIVDSLGGRGNKPLSLTIAAAPTITSSATLPKGEVNAVYSQSIAVSGGVAPFTFTKISGTLPAGLNVNTDGTITGTPTATGTSSFGVRATDSLGGFTTKTLSITVITALYITTASTLPSGGMGLPYTTTLGVSGGQSPFSWSKQSGNLPAGLNINSAGVISGTPTTSGSSTFVIQVTDSLGGLSSRTFTINIVEGPSITTESLPNGEIKRPYSQTLTVSGGVGPYTWSKVTGTLPTGLSFSASGTLSGTPTVTANSVSITFKVTDNLGSFTTKSLTITIVGTPVISSTSPLPGGEVNLVYSQSLTATSGVPPYTWTKTTGTLPAGLNLNLNGTISGTPTAAGSSIGTIRVTDSLGGTITKALTIVIAEAPSITTNSPLPGGGLNAAYNQALAGTGGVLAYTWTIQSGSLPNGLNLNPNGIISGSATALGTSSFTIRLTDSLGGTATKAFSITIVSGPAISTSSPLPNGEIRIAYSQTLTVSGGVGPYTWIKQSGTFPASLSMTTGGKISGTPTAAGTSAFTIKVTDSLGATAIKDFTINISAVPVISTASPLFSGEVNIDYLQDLEVTGGIAPYTWSKQSGTFPAGLNISSGGTISGTPTAAGTFSVTIKVTDGLGGTASKVFSITIAAAPAISTASPLPNGEVNYNYSQVLAVNGGVAPYTWSIQSGSLPAGLNLSPGGTISGTPTTAGTSTAAIEVEDNLGGTATRSFTVTIAAAPIITTNSPLPDGEKTIAYSQTLTVSGGVGPYNWSKQSGTLPAGLNISAAGKISGTPTAAGTSSVTVKVTDNLGGSVIKVFSITIAAVPVISTVSPLQKGEVNLAYLQDLEVTGGIAPFTWSKQSGTLPAGLNLNSGGTINGMPTTTGTFSVTVKVVDSLGGTATKILSITIVTAPAISTNSPLPNGAVNNDYNQVLAATGGVTPYTWTVQSGTLPAGLTLSPGGTISGTPTAAGASTATIKVTDNLGGTATRAFTITIAAAPVITTNSPLPNGEINFNYSQILAVNGGIGPYTWSKQSGTFPTGLNISAGGTISGKPTAATTGSVTIKVIDSLGGTATKVFSITIVPAPTVVTSSPLPNGEVNLAYSQNLTVNGGVGPFTWSTQTGTLPAGLNLNPNGTISGTPTAAVTSNFTLKVTDSYGGTASKAFTLTIINMPTITTNSPLATGEINVAYSRVLAVTGGSAPYTWSKQSGTFPVGLDISAGGIISGIPTAVETASVTIQVTDSLGGTATKVFSISIVAAPSISTTSPLTGGEVNIAYSQTLAATGGVSPYTWMVQSGSLPSGLSLSPGGLISGTPTTAQTSVATVRVTDSLGGTGTKTFSNTIVAVPTITTSSTLPHGDENYLYSQNLVVSGGMAPFTWMRLSGSLPDGLSLSQSGTISGTPTTVGASNFTLRVTDNLGGSATKSFSITIAARPAIVTNSTLPNGEVNLAYSQILTVSGGVPPYNWTIQSGSLPANLDLSAGGTISGTPTAAGTSNVTIRVTDNLGGTGTKDFSITIAVQPSISTTSPLPGGEVNLAYSQTLAVNGGVAPYNWAIQSGTLPAGLNFNPNGTISGNPSAAGTSNVTVRVTDNLGGTATRDFSITIANALEITTGSSLTNGEVNLAYSQNLEASGGVKSYTWAIQSGTLPAGLNFNPNGTISGTPAAAGTSNVTIIVTDNLGKTVSKVFSITIASAPVISTNSPLPDGGINGAYNQTLSVTGGAGPFTWSKHSGSLPAGLDLNPNGIINGTPTALGTSNFIIKVTDALGGTATKPFSITIISGPAIGTDSHLPDGEVGLVYSAVLSVSGGSSPYTWTILAGALPANLSLSPGGIISGTPINAGMSNITIQVEDNLGLKLSKEFTLTIAASPDLSSNAALANGAVNIAYSRTLTVTGGVAPYTWTVQTGVLPAGLNLAAGTISGTPTAAGTSNIKIRVTDVLGAIAEKNFSITIIAAPSILTNSPAPGAEAGVSYSLTMTVSGGTSPFTWSASGLPGGLTISEEGVISGTPSTPGNYTIEVTVHDSFAPANSVTKNIALAVYPRLQILNNTIAAGLLQKAYSEQIIFTGGVPPLVWTAENLPQGLSINPAGGVISGTPVTPGSYQIVITVKDAHNPAISESKKLTLKVYLPYDANGNGVVDMGDVVKVQRIISGLDPPTIAADANQDGKVNKDDILTIINYILGIPS